MTMTNTAKVQHDLNFIHMLVAQGGPEKHQYEEVIKWTNELQGKKLKGFYSKLDMKILVETFGKEFLNQTLQGNAYLKPCGYAGDFEMIDKIYTHHLSSIPKYHKWDAFFQDQHAPKAVRNRKTFFKRTLLGLLKNRTRPLGLLNVASGPCRDLMEVYQKIDPVMLQSTCVDMDPRAIAYAQELNKNYLEHITFIRKNVFKLRLEKQFDLVWSAGLFDYFDDKTFVFVLKNLYRQVKPGGQLIIGNFSENNPTRAYMETMGEWYLHHRSTDLLIQLAQQAGVTRNNIEVQREALGVNLFAVIHR